MSRLKIRIQNPNSPFGHHPEKNLTMNFNGLKISHFILKKWDKGICIMVYVAGWNNSNQEEEEEEEDEEEDPKEYESNN